MERGTPGEKQIPTGWLGRHLQITAGQNDSPFRAVGFGSMLQTALRGPVPTAALRSIADFHLRGNKDAVAQFQQALTSLYAGDNPLAQAGQTTFEAVDLLTKLNPAQYQPATGVKYPDGEYGLGLMQVAQLIKADVGLEVACIDIGGWDTHAHEGAADGELAKLLQEFGAGLAAFHADLQDRANSVTLVTMSEFGRRVHENASGGTDHGHGNVMFVMGGGVTGGKVYGDWPGLSTDKLAGPGDLAVTTDFRDVLGEIVKKRLLNDHIGDVFPNYTTWNFRNLLADRK
jgi:uncharacterized protein (DUF1501 family)